MEKLVTLRILDDFFCLCGFDENRMYELKVTPEVFTRAEDNMGFATELLEYHKSTGQTIFSNFTIMDNVTAKENTFTCNEPSTSKKSDLYNWSKDEVLLLISTYKDHQMLFLNTNYPKHLAWQKVVNDMTIVRAEAGLPPLDERKCKTKMETLKRRYKVLKDSNKKSGNHKITWPFFDEMEDLFAEEPWIKPLSTTGSNMPNKLDEETISPPLKRQKTLKDYCEQLLEGKKRREEVREQQHQEKNSTANRMTDVVAQLVANLNQRS